MDYNEARLIGTLQADPEIRTTNSGSTYANLRLMTEVPYVKDGEQKTSKEFHRVVLFGKLADIAADRFKKDQALLVAGRVDTREYEDSEGVKKSITEIVARDAVLLSNSPEGIQHVNSVMLVGRVGQDPKIGNGFMSFGLATKEVYGTNDDRKEKTTWHDVAVFNENAPAEGSVSKGGSTVVTGALHTRSWDSNGQKFYRTGIVADNVSPFTPPAKAPEQTNEEEGSRRTSRGAPAPFA